jgi:hypothetical protein
MASETSLPVTFTFFTERVATKSLPVFGSTSLRSAS